MGEVYRAFDLDLDRHVALKFLPPHASTDDTIKRRFTQEAKAASALDHPNICTIHGIGETPERQLYIIMPFYDGETLKQKIANGPLSVRESLVIAIQIAEGLRGAHQIGIVHRDIKPANIMITSGGRVKIVDFGIAKYRDSQFTRTGSTLGTVGYMSPEQARGEPVDHRTDIWALGVVLYEMLTGFAPFDGEYEQAIIYAILNKKHKSLSTVRPVVPPVLVQVVDKLLQKDVAERYQWMDHLLGDLYTAALEMGIDPRHTIERVLRSEDPRPGGARRAIIYTGLGFVFISLIIVLYAVFYPGKPTAITNISGLASSPAWSPDGVWLAFTTDESGNSDIWKRNIAGGPAIQITRSARNESSPSWSPDGKQIVYSADGDDGGIYAVSADGDPGSKLSAFGKNPIWSPSGNLIAFDLDGDIYTIPDSGGVATMLVRGTSSRPYAVWAPDGKKLIYWSRTGGDIYSLDLASGVSSPFHLIPVGEEVSGLSLSPEGTTMVISKGPFGGRKTLWRIAVDLVESKIDGAPQLLDIGTSDNVESAISPDGRLLAYTVRQLDRTMVVYSLDSVTGLPLGTPERVTFLGDLSLYPGLSPDGQSLVWTSTHSGPGVAQIMDLGTRETLKITGGSDDPTYQEEAGVREVYPQFAPDGRRLVYSSTVDGSYKLWLLPFVSGRGMALTQTEHPQRDVGPTWSPHGDAIAFFSNRSLNWDIWTVESRVGVQPRRLTDWDSNEMYPAWSPDGNTIAFTSDSSGNADIWIMGKDGLNAEPFVSHPAEEGWSSWSPDGNRFYFVSNRSGYFNVWMMEMADREPRQATHFRDPASGMPETAIFTKFAVSNTRLIVPFETRRGNIYVTERF